MPAQTETRPLRPDDWRRAPIALGKYSNSEELAGYQRSGGYAGNPLHPASGDDQCEGVLLENLEDLTSTAAPETGIVAQRFHVRMPYWRGQRLPRLEDYGFLSQPQSLESTSISVVLASNRPGLAEGLGFWFNHDDLPSLHARMAESTFSGLVGNLGYFMTPALIHGYAWSHNARFPGFRLDAKPSYIGLHIQREEVSGELAGSFPGAHPGAVGVKMDGTVRILPEVPLEGYDVDFGPRAADVVGVQSVNSADPRADVVAITPAFTGTGVVQDLTVAAEMTGGADENWQTCQPMIPFPAEAGRVNVFLANEGDGRWPAEKVITLWEGAAPVPSFGTVLSFSKSYFESLFRSVPRFREVFVGEPVRVLPHASGFDLAEYRQILGGLVPAVVAGAHTLYESGTIADLMKSLGRSGATSPIAQCGRESRNFDPIIREPAGVLIQTATHVGWVLFDGRHELSVGASTVDVGVLLKKLEVEGALGGRVEQAVFVDGGSAMKVYHVSRSADELRLGLLNRVAAGSRNRPGSDPEGLNLYSTLRLCLSRPRTGEG